MEQLQHTDSQMGLSEKEAAARLKKFGKNILAKKSKFFILKELLSSFFSPLILLLLAASLVSAFLGDIADFFIIFSIVLLSGGISFYQHFKAENAANRLKNRVSLTATVIRNGEQKEIPFAHVVVGDIVMLSVGDLVPADIKLIEIKELSIDESSLTGESFPAEKNITDKTEHKTIAFAGTHVVTGEATGIVIATGKNSQIGQLSEKIVENKPQTAFDTDIKDFSILVIRIILVLTSFIFLVNALFHHNLLSSFLFSVALAVGLTPELMPVIITVSLSRGAIRMEKKEVIVKFLPSIQNLGGMDTLCMDKTGTITENNILLSSYENALGKKDETVLFLAKLNSFLQSGFKNPLDKALLAYNSPLDAKTYTKIDEIPFDFERKKLSIIISHGGKLQIITKGSAVHVLQSIDSYFDGKRIVQLGPTKLKTLQKRAEQLANNGYRVIGIAQKNIKKQTTYTPQDESHLTFVGFVLFTDPVKKTVATTLKTMISLGISPKILTGDNSIVAKKTCKDAGIDIDNIIEGSALRKLSEEQINKLVETTTVFADLTPEQKAQVIQSLRKKGHIVGYLGDGINDAPPLKAADIGISVNNGSDVAKDVSDIILMRKSLSVMIDGIIEGRKTYVNTFKYIMMSLSSNFGNMMSVAIASIFLPFLPLLPTQILLIDFLYDSSQLAVSSDRVDDELISKPRKWSMHFLKRFTFIFGPLSSVFDIITFFVLLTLLHASVPVFRTGWFIESFVTQTLVIFAIRTHLVPFFRSRPSILLVISALITLCIGFGIIFSPVGRYFAFVSVPAIFWIILIAEVIFYFTCVEITKLFFYKGGSQ